MGFKWLMTRCWSTLSRAIPAFLIVGSPRSGTTLVQRLACELPGVWVPYETHFFSQYVIRRIHHLEFPMSGPKLIDEIQAWQRTPSVQQIPISAEEVAAELGGRAASLWEIFGAIVRVMSPPERVILGEKTPDHVRWAPLLLRCIDDLKVIAVVRDPRDVVRSTYDVPFRSWPIEVQVERWKCEQRLIARASVRFGPERWLTLRYEDVVVDPAGTRRVIGAFLGVSEMASSTRVSFQDIALPWESWKRAATKAITTTRRFAWRRELDPSVAALVEALARREMRRFAYPVHARRTEAARRIATLSPGAQYGRVKERRRFAAYLRRVERARVIRALSAAEEPSRQGSRGGVVVSK